MSRFHRHDDWKAHNPDDDYLGPEPRPCLPRRTRSRIDPTACVDCGAPEGECWWELGQFEVGALMRDKRKQ